MSKLSNAVDSCLSNMKSAGGTGKGSFGEEAVFKICEQIYQQEGGILYHSYTYKTDPRKQGNIKRGVQGNLYEENLGASTEIDILLVTKHNIFPIEVKAYRAKEIILTDDGIDGCFMKDKSPVHQNEMHASHLYEAIFKAIPEGESKRIKPIVVFVDNCAIRDKRSQKQKDYIKVTILNNLKAVIAEMDTKDKYRLDLNAVSRALVEATVKYEKLLPVRNI